MGGSDSSPRSAASIQAGGLTEDVSSQAAASRVLGAVGRTVDNINAALEIAASHGCHPLRGVATYEDVYKLTYLRGPSGILVMFAEELKKED